MNLFKNEKFLILFLASTVAILILIKVILYKGCYAFDSNDDVNHTFVNLKAAQDIMRQGEIPEINLYNNFGTPILGDALTFPFSLQSITYWVLPNYLAMTVNRALIAFLTIIFLFLFLRTFLSPLSSMIASLLVFFSPGAFWNFAHHHYQMTLLCFSFILYIQCKICRRPQPPSQIARHPQRRSRVGDLLLLWLGYVVFFLSVSIQLVVFAIPFLILFMPVKYGFKFFRLWMINIITLTSVAILTWPHTYMFFKNIALSTRAHWSPYSGIFSSARQQVLSIILPAGEWMHFGMNGHFSIATYFSIAFIIFTLVGILLLISNLRKNISIFLIILLLGIIPTIAGYILQYYGQNIPFVKSVDSTRIWWFSILFLSIAIGKLLDASWSKDFNYVLKFISTALACSLIVIYFFINRIIPEFSDMAVTHRLVFLGTSFGLLLIVFSSKVTIMKIGKSLILSVLLLAQIPTFVQVMGLNLKSCDKGNHYFAHKKEATFQPHVLLGRMQKDTRLMTEEYPVNGHDLKAIFGNVLGSNARAIVSSRNLMEVLNQNNLIKVDDNYFFKPPWQTEKLSKLGIRYLLLTKENKELKSHGWNLIQTAQYLGQEYYLYESVDKASPLYILQNEKPLFITNYRLLPNRIEVDLPKITSNTFLVATFYPWSSWMALLDGTEIKPTITKLGMMQVPIKPTSRSVIFKYQRIKMIHILFAFIISFAIFSILFFIPSKVKNE